MTILYPHSTISWIIDKLRAPSVSCLTPLVLLALLQQSALATSFEPADCIDFINERPARVTCGFFSLPADHSTALAKEPSAALRRNIANISPDRITVPVLIASSNRSLTAKRDSAVLIPGGGGPGSSIGFGYPYEQGDFLAPYQSLRQEGFDVVIVDQRGAGLSKPRLSCPESIEAFESMLGKKRSIEDELNAFQNAIGKCRNNLRRQSINVDLFDTRQSALDFLAIMKKLDYPRWFTIATSYATTIAQAMQALQPGAFDRIVLDSPVPLHYQQPMTLERARTAIAESVERCAQVSSCSNRYPDLQNTLDSVLTKAAATPYLIKIKIYQDDGSSEIRTVVADDTILLNILTTAIYYNDHISELPKVLTELNKGLPQALNGFAETFWYQATDSTFADGLNMTVHCKERQLLEDEYVSFHPGFNNNLSQASRLILQSQLNLCHLWGVSAQPDLLPRLMSATKTLVLAGGLDPVISTEDIISTASYFSARSVEVVAGAGHSVWYQHECARARVVEFLAGRQDSASARCEAAVPGFK